MFYYCGFQPLKFFLPLFFLFAPVLLKCKSVVLMLWLRHTFIFFAPFFLFLFCPFFVCRWQSVCLFFGTFTDYILTLSLFLVVVVRLWFWVLYFWFIFVFVFGFLLWFWFGFLCSPPALKRLSDVGFRGKREKRKRKPKALTVKGLERKLKLWKTFLFEPI
jgi:hypothetical protein